MVAVEYGKFNDDPTVKELGYRKGTGRRPWVRLTEDLIYTTSTGYTITVPAGFESDKASVPWFFWRLCPADSDANAAAYVHDYLYRETKCSKVLADAIFLDAMMALDVEPWRRKLMYKAVAYFGGGAFRKCRKEQKE